MQDKINNEKFVTTMNPTTFRWVQSFGANKKKVHPLVELLRRF